MRDMKSALSEWSGDLTGVNPLTRRKSGGFTRLQIGGKSLYPSATPKF